MMDTKTRSKHWQEIAGTRIRNLYIYYACKFHSENGQVKRGTLTKLGKELGVCRERIRQIYRRMEVNNGL